MLYECFIVLSVGKSAKPGKGFDGSAAVAN